MTTKLSNRALLLRWSTWTTICNVLIAIAISARYLSYLQTDQEILTFSYLITTSVTLYSSLFLLPTILLSYGFIAIFPRKHFVFPIHLLINALLILFLVLDSSVFSLYRMHLDGAIISMIFSDAASEIFQFSTASWVAIALFIVGILVIEVLIGYFCWQLVIKNKSLKGKLVATFIIICILFSQSVHVWADANYEKSITKLTKYFPLYLPLTGKRKLQKLGLVNINHSENNQIKTKQSLGLNYPLLQLQFKKNGKPLNIIMITIDCWRFDALNQKVTPNIFKFAQNSNRFENHFSGGNATRMGIFSMFYSLPSTYWKDVLNEQIPPVLITQLQEQNYQLGIFASSRLTNPEFNRTVFSSVTNLRLKSNGATSSARDIEITDEWLTFNKQSSQPQFSWLFYDTVHAYKPPANYPKHFQPAWDEVNHLKLNNDLDPTQYKNLYNNSLHFVDSQVNRVLQRLEETNQLDNTVVIITGDHGEEFNDNKKNYWGHNGNFTRYQTSVPMVVHWPNKKFDSYKYKTSHMDIVPTIMQDALHCETPINNYATGVNLFTEQERKWLLIGAYSRYAVVEDDRINLVLPTGQLEVLDLNNKELDLPARGQVIFQAIQQMQRFNQK